MIMRMLRRASVDIDVDRINMAGMTALHQVSEICPTISVADPVKLVWRIRSNWCGGSVFNGQIGVAQSPDLSV